MKRIKQLEENLINQIAAGEVVERPASVVKELVENSIDAQASRIEIDISNDCRNIRVADNGSGIYHEDIELAFLRHATSKIKSQDDLFNISSLGFRGEALASIISISRVSCTSRQKDFDYGMRVIAENSNVSKSKVGCAIGTIMEVKDLFYNVPARLNFLKNSSVEFSHIQELVQSIMLSHKEISFILKRDGKTILKTSATEDLKQTIKEVYTEDLEKYLRKTEAEDLISKYSLEGYVTTPDYTRSSKKGIYTFLNGRVIRCPIILKAIDTAYKNRLPIKRYPLVVLNIEMPASDFDINVHPSKKEVKYKNANQIFNFVYSTIMKALQDNTVSMFNNKYDDFNSAEIVSNKEEKVNYTLFEKKSNLIDYDKMKTKAEEAVNLYLPLEKVTNVNQEENVAQNFTIIGQFHNTYILFEMENELHIVDQHIADERYIYEKLKKLKNNSSQILLVSDIIKLEPTEIELIKENKEVLNEYGYGIEIISKDEVIVRKIPSMIAHLPAKEILSSLLETMEDTEHIERLDEKIIITTSCKAAVKAGEKLTFSQMNKLISNWLVQENKHTCPHGRKIDHRLSVKEVAAFFGRTFKAEE